MGIDLRENPYRGVNAHLHSALQSPGGNWQSFHGAYIVDLTRAITAMLPPGYYAINEKSLQLIEVSGAKPERRRTVFDVGVYHQPKLTTRQETAAKDALVLNEPASSVPVVETLSDEDYLQAVVIYDAREDKEGVPVTRIELLSPANKPPGSHYPLYVAKRDETLLSGINLIEIDLLHEQPSPVKIVPSYPDREPGASPYIILVSNPHPSVREGPTDFYPFFVDDPIPIIRAPLTPPDTIDINFGNVYQQTFAANPYYGIVAVDYAHDPLRFETYASEDQTRIRQRMALIAQERV